MEGYSVRERNVRRILFGLSRIFLSVFLSVDLHNFHVERRKERRDTTNDRNRGEASRTKGTAKDPRSAKYQRLSREIERLCIEIRMYRLPSTTTQSGTRFSNLKLVAAKEKCGNIFFEATSAFGCFVESLTQRKHCAVYVRE